MCNLSASSVAQYETGARNPSKKALYKICEVYNKSPKFFNLSTNSPYISNERSSNMDKIMNNLVDYNEVLKKENEELKVYKDRRQLQDMANNSIGIDTWVIQTKVVWKGLTVEISIVDWGNTYDTLTKVLGYDDAYVKNLMSNTQYKLADNIFNPILKKNTITHLMSIAMRIPAILGNLITGTYQLDVPMIYKHKDGSSVYAIGANSLSLTDRIVNTTIHFTPKDAV